MDLLSLLVTIIVVGLIFYLLYWLVGQLPLPAPFGVVVQVILALCVVIFLISILLGHTAMPTFRWR